MLLYKTTKQLWLPATWLPAIYQKSICQLSRLVKWKPWRTLWSASLLKQQDISLELRYMIKQFQWIVLHLTSTVVLLLQLKLNPPVELSGDESIGNDHYHPGDKEQDKKQQEVPERRKTDQWTKWKRTKSIQTFKNEAHPHADAILWSNYGIQYLCQLRYVTLLITKSFKELLN